MKTINHHTARPFLGLLLLTATLMLCPPVSATPSSATEDQGGPAIAARAAVLLDATTGTELYAKNPDLVIQPASLTKLMTIHLVLEAVQSGRLSLDQEVSIPEIAWATKQEPGSSLMFLGPGQRLTLRELILGLAVCSGNDAAQAAAITVAGSIPTFVQMMNDEAQRIGLGHTAFVEPSGVSENNWTTAREFSTFCRYYLARHPEALASFHSVAEFTYPKPENRGGSSRELPIRQFNRNNLLGQFQGVDGLKTGFIKESGYNFALTAERSGTRLLAVLLGGPGDTTAQGLAIRGADGRAILDWGFRNYRTIRPEIQNLDPVRIWRGKDKTVAIEVEGTASFTAAMNRGTGLHWEITRKKGVTAPIAKGAVLGEILFSDSQGILSRTQLIATKAVPKGAILKRAIDSIALFFLQLFGKLS